MHNKDLGKFGESVAALYFKNKGYEILDRNFYCRYGEIDIVAIKDGKLFFIEVKTRTNLVFGEIENSISDFKLNRLKNSIESYLEKNKIDCDYFLIFSFVFFDKKNKKAKIKIVEYL